MTIIDGFGYQEKDIRETCVHISISMSLPRQDVIREKPNQKYYTPETNELARKIFVVDSKMFIHAFI